jgi:hypothetical protein
MLLSWHHWQRALWVILGIAMLIMGLAAAHFAWAERTLGRASNSVPAQSGTPSKQLPAADDEKLIVIEVVCFTAEGRSRLCYAQ